MLLITGGSGFVGQNLAGYFGPRRQTVATYLTHAPVDTASAQSVRLDVRDAEAVFSVFERVLPEVVIHAAGNKNLVFCEEHPDEAHRINALGTRNVARACREFGASMIYLSTDLVFGCVEGGYREDDVPRPALAYGRSKLEGERLALEELNDLAVCRSGGIFGRDSPLLKWLSAEVEAGRSVECFVDVFNTPTYVENLAEMMDAVIRKRLVGVYHTVGRERVSRFEFFRSYADTFGLDASLLSPVSSAGLKEKLLLQPDASLSAERTAERLGVAFNSVAEGFVRLKASGGV
ncbi:MAG: SDR family oxidoreductase [Acidobacteria bacterium]|nr:SDR family oxidoreductase [Acidobacteriota bacterium]MCA1640864.1 SDR family oxidoreductase [Acidobacteriota bacterium]